MSAATTVVLSVLLVLLGGVITVGTQQIGEVLTGRRRRRDEVHVGIEKRLTDLEITSAGHTALLEYIARQFPDGSTQVMQARTAGERKT